MKDTSVRPRQSGEDLRVTLSRQPLPVITSCDCNVDKNCRSYRKQRRGASAVEFAIVAPVFFLLVFGMIEFGRMCMVQQLLTNASREGARQAVLDGTTSDQVKDVVQNYLSNAAVPVARENITVTPDPTTADSGQPVTVTVGVNFTDVSWLPGAFFLGGTRLESSAVMRREGVQ